jgi:hypothetical protein
MCFLLLDKSNAYCEKSRDIQKSIGNSAQAGIDLSTRKIIAYLYDAHSFLSALLRHAIDQTVAQRVCTPDQVLGSKRYAGKVGASVSRRVQSD